MISPQIPPLLFPHPYRTRCSRKRNQSHLSLGASIHRPAEYYLGGVSPTPERVSISGIVPTIDALTNGWAGLEYFHRITVRSLHETGCGVDEVYLVLVARHVDRHPCRVERRPEYVARAQVASGLYWQGEYRCCCGGIL